MAALAYELARLIGPLHVPFSAGRAVGKMRTPSSKNHQNPTYLGPALDFARLIREGLWSVNLAVPPLSAGLNGCSFLCKLVLGAALVRRRVVTDTRLIAGSPLATEVPASFSLRAGLSPRPAVRNTLFFILHSRVSPSSLMYAGRH